MKKTVKALSKQIFGAKYESIRKSLLISVILFVAVYAAELRVAVAPFILYLTSTVFTWGVMRQILRGRRQAETLKAMLMLPFGGRGLVFSYVLVVGGYTIITKTLPVWMLFFAAGSWSCKEVITALICGCNACVVSACVYLLLKKRNFILPVVWCGGFIAVILGVRESRAVLAAAWISLAGAILYLFFADAYSFYNSASEKKAVLHTGSPKGVAAYLVRYLLANKSYLVNSAGLCVAAGFLPLLFGESFGGFQGLNILPVGFAVLSLNTPICTLMSCDPDLQQAIRMLPGQAGRFCMRYGVFISVVNLFIMCIYLCSWQLVSGGVSFVNIWTAVVFAVQSALISAVLEWRYPICGWKTESDLWHHPRKYLVPLLMMVMSAFLSTWAGFIWIWSGVLLIECCAASIVDFK